MSNINNVHTEQDEERAKDIIMFMAFLQDLISDKGRREEKKRAYAAGTAEGKSIEEIDKELGIDNELDAIRGEIEDKEEVTQDMIIDEMAKAIKGRFYHWYPDEEFIDVVKDLSVVLDKLVGVMKKSVGGGLTEESYNKLVQKIARGEYFYAVYKDDEYRQFRKRDLELDVLINKSDLYAITEYAIVCACNRCTKINKKKCVLRKHFLSAGIPTQNYDIDDLIYIRARAKELEEQALGLSDEELDKREIKRRKKSGIRYNTECEYYYNDLDSFSNTKTRTKEIEDRINELQEELTLIKRNCRHQEKIIRGNIVFCSGCKECLGWHCKESPTQSCVYDYLSTEGKEKLCIYCNKPEKRSVD